MFSPRDPIRVKSITGSEPSAATKIDINAVHISVISPPLASGHSINYATKTGGTKKFSQDPIKLKKKYWRVMSKTL